MKSYLAQQTLHSPLGAASIIRPKQGAGGKALVATLILTSLVDVFSILVIYLLVNTSAANETLDLNKEIRLPLATQSEILSAGLLVKVNKDQYEINETKIPAAKLFDHLHQSQTKLDSNSDERAGKLIIQADKASAFEMINPVVTAGVQAGFEVIKFAVMPKESSE